MSKTTINTPSKNGQVIRQDYGRDHSDDKENRDEQMRGKELKGNRGDLSHSIVNGKVPEE